MDNPKTAIRTYPVAVIDMKGEPVKAGELVELPLDKVKEHELRFGLKSDDRVDATQVKKPTASTGTSSPVDPKLK